MSTTKVTIRGIAFFASVQHPNPSTGVFSIDLAVDDATKALLEGHGLKPARKADGSLVSHEGQTGTVFRFKRKTLTRDGRVIDPPVVADSNGVLTKVLVGNGSLVQVSANIYDYKVPGGKEGKAGGLNSVQIIDLVPFESGRKMRPIADGKFRDTGILE